MYSLAQEKSSFFAFRRGTTLARNNDFRGEKLKSLISPRVFSAKFRGETPRHFAQTFRDISRRHSTRFRRGIPRNFSMGKVSSCGQRRLYSDGETERMPSLIWVFTRRVIKPTPNRYVPNIITGCATIGEEQCTCNCNFIHCILIKSNVCLTISSSRFAVDMDLHGILMRLTI